jgi:hypothetical protein
MLCFLLENQDRRLKFQYKQVNILVLINVTPKILSPYKFSIEETNQHYVDLYRQFVL